VTNTATAHGVFDETTYDSAPSSATVTFAAAPALSLVKTASPTTYTGAGDPITYTYTIKNIGNVALAGFSVDDNKIAAVDCSLASASLAPGDSTTCTATYTILAGDAVVGGSVTNTATAHGVFDETTYDSAPSSATVTFAAAPALSLVKTASPTTYTGAGDPITYTYTIKNIGNVALAGFSVDDNKIAAVDCSLASASLAPGDSTTCTATYTILAGDAVVGGSVTNTATAHGVFDETTYDSAPSSATVTFAAARP